MWIEENARPVVTVTGSHRHFCMFGAISLEGKQLFKQYDRFNENTFYEFLKLIHYKFPKCYLFLDKAPQHYKSQKIKQYLQKHKQARSDTNLAVNSVTRVHDSGGRMLEHIYKKDLLVLMMYYPSIIYRF